MIISGIFYSMNSIERVDINTDYSIEEILEKYAEYLFENHFLGRNINYGTVIQLPYKDNSELRQYLTETVLSSYDIEESEVYSYEAITFKSVEEHLIDILCNKIKQHINDLIDSKVMSENDIYMRPKVKGNTITLDVDINSVQRNGYKLVYKLENQFFIFKKGNNKLYFVRHENGYYYRLNDLGLESVKHNYFNGIRKNRNGNMLYSIYKISKIKTEKAFNSIKIEHGSSVTMEELSEDELNFILYLSDSYDWIYDKDIKQEMVEKVKIYYEQFTKENILSISNRLETVYPNYTIYHEPHNKLVVVQKNRI